MATNTGASDDDDGAGDETRKNREKMGIIRAKEIA